MILADGNGKGNQFNGPSSIFIDQVYSIYVSNEYNHRIMKWIKGATEGIVVVGGNKEGQQSNQFYCPRSLSFDREGNLYVGDSRNYGIQKFKIDLLC